MTRRTERAQRREQFAAAQCKALLSAITATSAPPEVGRRIRELAAAGDSEGEIAEATGLSIVLVRKAMAGQSSDDRPEREACE